MHALGARPPTSCRLAVLPIAIGAMVDAAIIMIENAHKELDNFRDNHGREPTGAERTEVVASRPPAA